MITAKHAKVECDDKALGYDLDDAYVVITGTSPKAVCTINAYSPTGKTDRVDRLVDCEVKPHRKGGHVVVGTSLHLRDEVGVAATDQKVSLHVGPSRRCSTC